MSSQLGNQSTAGGTFQVNVGAGWGDIAGGFYTVPSPGIIVSQLHAQAGNGGTSQNCRLYVWQDASGIPGTWLIRGSATQTIAGMGLQTQTVLAANGGAGITSDLYLPAGTKIWIGIFLSAGSGQIQGAGSGSTELGNTNDGNWSDHGPAGFGEMAAWLDYNPLAAPTLSSDTPSTAAAGQTVALVGTGLLHTTGITVCGVTAPTFTITDDAHITVTVPAGAAGAGNIVVTTPAGTASIAFTAGSLYADNASSFLGGVTVSADDGATWHSAPGATAWADDGAAWHQIG